MKKSKKRTKGLSLKQRIKYIIKAANYRKLLDSDLDYRDLTTYPNVR